MTRLFSARRGSLFVLGALSATLAGGSASLVGCSSSDDKSNASTDADAGTPKGNGNASPDGSSAPPDTTAPDDDGGNEAGGPTPTFTLSEDVEASTEVFKCKYVTVPQGSYVTGGAHTYTVGSHHFLLYTTSLTSIPAGGDQLKDCDEGDGAALNSVRGIFYAAQTPTANLKYPDGVGLPVTQGQVLLLQVHYLNPSAKTLHVDLKATFTFSDGHDITTNAGTIFWYDPFIHVPAGKKASARMRCPIPKDITLIGAASHYHKRGVSYGAWLEAPVADGGVATGATSADGGDAGAPFYTSNNWEDPETLQGDVKIAAGSKIRFQCDYDNSSGSTEFFQGQSANTNEMCMFVAAYYPAIDHDMEFCLAGGDEFGTGTKTCVDTLSCLSKCVGSAGDAGVSDAAAPADAGTTSAAGGGSDLQLSALTPCIQGCFTDSCPSAATTLMPVVSCLQTSCASACGGSATATTADGGTDAGFDPVGSTLQGLGSLVQGVGALALAPVSILLGQPIGGDPCTTCLQQKCGAPLSACASATCN